MPGNVKWKGIDATNAIRKVTWLRNVQRIFPQVAVIIVERLVTLPVSVPTKDRKEMEEEMTGNATTVESQAISLVTVVHRVVVTGTDLSLAIGVTSKDIMPEIVRQMIPWRRRSATTVMRRGTLLVTVPWMMSETAPHPVPTPHGERHQLCYQVV